MTGGNRTGFFIFATAPPEEGEEPGTTEDAPRFTFNGPGRTASAPWTAVTSSFGSDSPHTVPPCRYTWRPFNALIASFMLPHGPPV